MIKLIAQFARRIMFILCIVVIVAGIYMPLVYAGTNITDSPAISSVQGNVTSISNTSGEYQRTYPLMHFTKDQLDEMQREVNAAPKYSAPTAPQRLLAATQSSPPVSMSLLGYLPYTPSQRNQGKCGNCWVWASTGAMEISHTINSGISDRLSIQWFDDNYGTGPLGQDSACGGGTVTEFTNWYNTDKTAIPWSNTNAYWGDGNDAETAPPWGPTTPPLISISTQPYYKLNSLSESKIQTYGVGQATAINTIKGDLNSNQPVVYTFHLPDAGWTDFFNFWNTYPETGWYNPSYYNGFTDDGGHEVLIVGYDDSTDTNTPYWIVVNSWGAPSNRPDGLFRLYMNMNYDAVFYESGGGPYQQNTFYVLNSVFTPPTVTGISPTAGPIAGGTTVTIKGININGATTVKFGTTAATSYTVNSANSITATAPAVLPELLTSLSPHLTAHPRSHPPTNTSMQQSRPSPESHRQLVRLLGGTVR